MGQVYIVNYVSTSIILLTQHILFHFLSQHLTTLSSL